MGENVGLQVPSWPWTGKADTLTVCPCGRVVLVNGHVPLGRFAIHSEQGVFCSSACADVAAGLPAKLAP